MKKNYTTYLHTLIQNVTTYQEADKNKIRELLQNSQYNGIESTVDFNLDFDIYDQLFQEFHTT